MDRKKRLRIILILVSFLLVCICIIGMIVIRSNLSSTHNNYIKFADRYYDSGNYNQAVISYEEAIENGIYTEELYIRLAKAYKEMGQLDKALYYVEEGLKKYKDSEELKRLYDEYTALKNEQNDESLSDENSDIDDVESNAENVDNNSEQKEVEEANSEDKNEESENSETSEPSYTINGVRMDSDKKRITIPDDRTNGVEIELVAYLDISGDGDWDNELIKWSSNDSNIHIENENTLTGDACVIVCYSAGTYTVTAEASNGATAECTVEVAEPDSESIYGYFENEKIYVNVGDTFDVAWHTNENIYGPSAGKMDLMDISHLLNINEPKIENDGDGYKITYTFIAKNAGEDELIVSSNNYTISCMVYVSGNADNIGDINNDGNIDLNDVLKLRRYISYSEGKSSNESWALNDDEMKRADINGDGNIDAADVLKLKRYIAAKNNDETIRNHPGWLVFGASTADDDLGEGTDGV